MVATLNRTVPRAARPDGRNPMDQHLVFAISREYGSGGREIGEKLAEQLGIAYYDKLLLKRIAEESGLDGSIVEDFDEKPLRPLLLNPNSFFCGSDLEHPVASHIYKTEVDLLKSIADEGSCVIVGRCADYVLANHPGLVSLFVSAPMDARVQRVMRRNNLSESQARSRITRVDKARASYYRSFTDEHWGHAGNYDLCINSGGLDAEGAVAVIRSFMEQRERGRQADARTRRTHRAAQGTRRAKKGRLFHVKQPPLSLNSAWPMPPNPNGRRRAPRTRARP